MKNLIIILILIFSLGKLTAQEYIRISGLSIKQINESQIETNLRVDELFGTTVYNSHTTEVNGNVITLKVCYDIYMFDGGETIENDFVLDIPSNPGNYTLKVEIYPWGSDGCFQTQYIEDSATLDFVNPFEGTIFLSTTNIKNNDSNVKLYPNPVKDVLIFSEEVSNIKITDLSGKLINQISRKEKYINVSTLAKGIYMITAITKSGKKISKKIIKE